VGEGRGGETRRDERVGAELASALLGFRFLFLVGGWRERNALPWIFLTQHKHTKKKRDDDDDEVEGFGVGLVDLTWSP